MTRSERRLAERVRRPDLRVLVGTRSYAAENWSLKGMLLRDYAEPRQVGDRLSLLAAPEMSTGQARLDARVVRIDRRRAQLAVSFESIEPGSFKALEGFLKLSPVR